MASTEAEIRKVETAIRELTVVTKDFAKIEEMYGVLMVFWGRMLGQCMSVTKSDVALLKMIGMELLTADAPDYEYAMQCTGELKTGAEAYMDLISKQGIVIPEEPSDDDDSDAEEGVTLASLASVGNSRPERLHSLQSRPTQAIFVKQLTMQIANAQDALSQGDEHVYETLMEQATEATLASVTSSNQVSIQLGNWFDIASLKVDAGVFLSGALQANLNNLGPSGGEALLKGAMAIGSLVQSQKNVVESVQATFELAQIMSAWSNDPFSEDSEERMRQIEKYKKPALRFCHMARDSAMIANNSFADINHMAQDSAADLKRKIQGQRDEIGVQEILMYDEARHIYVPFPLELFGSRKQIIEFVQSKAEEIQRKYEVKISSLEDVIQQYEASLYSWATCEGQAVSWVEMCKVISRNLAFLQTTLDAMGKELKIDALLYKELMETQWHNIINNTSEVLSIVGVPFGGEREKLIPQVLGFSMNLVTNGVSAALMSIDVSPSPKMQLIAAIGSDHHLAQSLNKWTARSSTFFAAMRQLDTLPFAADINAGTSFTSPKTMLEIVTDIRRQYSRLAAENLDTVSSIQTLACTQQFALKQLTSSTRRDVQIKQMLVLSAGALKAANRTSEAWTTAEADFEEICRTVQSNVDTYAALMKDIDAAVAKQQKDLDDYIAGITADAIAVCTVSLAVGATMLMGPKTAWKLVSQVPTLYGLQGLGWKDMFKTYYKNLDISEKAACVARLKAFKSNMDTAAIKLTSAKDSFKVAVISAQDTGLAVARTYARLMDVSERIQTVGSVVLEPADVEEIVFNWDEVAHAAQEWTDEFSKQGISPILYQADIDVEPQTSEESEEDKESNESMVKVNGTH